MAFDGVIRRHEAAGIRSEAAFSGCGAYRYRLTRVWDDARPRVAWVMLNPSTADEMRNDPTIERCERRSRAMGCGGYLIVNLHAFRATRPRDLLAAADPVGPDNDAALAEAARWSGRVICGWGAHACPDRAARAASVLRDHGATLFHLGLTKSGQPRHPLYVAYAVAPQPWD